MRCQLLEELVTYQWS